MSPAPELTPAGLPKCMECPVRAAAIPMICYTCFISARAEIPEPHCEICDQHVAGNSCGNALCRQATRHVGRIRAIGEMSGGLETAIKALKYAGKYGWATVLGRVLLEHITLTIHDRIDLVVANPSYLEPGATLANGRPAVRHAEAIVFKAAVNDVFGLWGFDTSRPRTLIKTKATTKSAARGRTLDEKRQIAKEHADALAITDRSRIAGKRLLVFDDVETTGFQMDAVAGYLLKQGARSVDGIVLARAPWRY